MILPCPTRATAVFSRSPRFILMCSVVPTSRFSRLSLGSMAPTTRSFGRGMPQGDEVPRNVVAEPGSPGGDEGNSASVGEEDEEDYDEDSSSTVVRSPATKISYDISGLDLDTQSEVRQLFRETPASEPPSLVLEWCQLNHDQRDKDGQFYAFQLHEVEIIPRSIRIGSPGSKYASPKCNCMQDSDKPCRHLIYLLDQINSIASDPPQEEPVQRLGPSGVPVGMGQPFERISNFHLDLLSSSLHCDVGSPDSKAEVSRVRLEETREILASIANADADDLAVKEYRNDIFQDRGSLLKDHDIVTHGDLTKTLVHILVTNDDFFAYFLKLLPPSSRARDPFHKIQQHVDRVLAELDGPPRATPAEGPRDAAWAAAHMTRAASRIQALLQHRDDAPSPAERAAAARTLVRILHAVVFRGHSSSSSSPPPPPPPAAAAAVAAPASSAVLDALAQLPEQNQWIEALVDVEERLVAYGAPAGALLVRLRGLLAQMRRSRPAAPAAPSSAAVGETARQGGGSGAGGGSKRAGGDGGGREGGAKRPR